MTDTAIYWIALGALGGLGAGAAVFLPVIQRARRQGRRWKRLASRMHAEASREILEAHPGSDQEYAAYEKLALHLAQEEHRLRAVVNAMVEGMALLDESGRVVFSNPAFAAMFRATNEKSISQDSFSAATVQEYLRALESARTGRKVATVELQLATTPPRDVLITATPYSDGSLQQGVVLTAADVTARKRVEQMRTEFVANVSHELRTPLAAIRGYVETCLEPVEEGEEPPYERFLPIIQQHTMRLNALIEDLLILSRIESKAMPLKLQPMALAPVVEAAIGTLAPAAEKKRLRLLNALPAVLPDVKADSSAVERILLNLVENAIKYSDEGSEVRVTARLQTDHVVVMVQDQGIGIPKEDQTRVFERFYRVDKARSRKAGGTGLGLSIVKHLVQGHGGDVWVDSEPGRGSTFFFTLPLGRG